jgi:hypothetical protein
MYRIFSIASVASIAALYIASMCMVATLAGCTLPVVEDIGLFMLSAHR